MRGAVMRGAVMTGADMKGCLRHNDDTSSCGPFPISGPLSYKYAFRLCLQNTAVMRGADMKGCLRHFLCLTPHLAAKICWLG